MGQRSCLRYEEPDAIEYLATLLHLFIRDRLTPAFAVLPFSDDSFDMKSGGRDLAR